MLGSLPKPGTPDAQVEAQVLTMMRHFLALPDPDFTTSPSTWGKYVGKYVGAHGAATHEITLSGNELRISTPLWSPSDPVVMKQGGSWASSAGDSFHYLDPRTDTERYVVFFPGTGDGTKMQYMLREDPWLLAERVTE